MALWKDQYGREQNTPDPAPEKTVATVASVDTPRAAAPAARPAAAVEAKESVLAAGLTIEQGAKITGSVRANTVVVGGELEGNIDAATRVELLQTGVLNGDLKAGSLTVAAGSRMRGRAEFGWDEKGGK